MPEVSRTPLIHSVRLGPFELDPRSAELHQNGSIVRLPEQPFQILLLLVEHPGEVVTREQLRNRLWQSDTFVDFDHGLNTAMKRLRHALGDSAENPRYIETLPRHGYRLIVPVERPGPPATTTPPLSIRRLLVPLAAFFVITAVATMFSAWRRSLPRLTDKDTIVLSDFENKTGDPVFDDTLKQGLAVQLEQSPFLELASQRTVSETLRRMGRLEGTRLTPDIAYEVCERISSKAMLTGSITSLGSQYVIGLSVINCETGRILARTQEGAAGKEAVLKALDKAATSLRNQLGESLTSVQKYDTPLEEATTPSLEALKAYSLGMKTSLAEGNTAPLPFYQRAVELDPKFAEAYAAMSVAYLNLHEFERASENARKAYELRQRVSERERFHIEQTYYMAATGELEKAAQSDEIWKHTYPRDGSPHTDLGFIYAHLGNWQRALDEFQEALRLEPSDVVHYGNLAMGYMAFNRLEDAESVYNLAQQRSIESEFLLQTRCWLAFLQGDTSQMARLVSAATAKPGVADLLLATQADTEGWYGRLQNARELTARAMDSAQLSDARERAAAYQASAALRDVEAGYRKQARVEAARAMGLAPSNRDVLAVTALALARAGDLTTAENLASALDKAFPLDTLVQRYWLPTIRAAVALQRRDPNRAIELLGVAKPIELRYSSTILCPAYLRGESYLMLRDGNHAAAEFQKFIDNRGLVRNFPWGALARHRLARAYVLQGDRIKARSAYQDFLTLWKDADPDVPILKQAKAEYAKLT
jgi:eukaryotic-like serine/threonine-protein kinase